MGYLIIKRNSCIQYYQKKMLFVKRRAMKIMRRKMDIFKLVLLIFSILTGLDTTLQAQDQLCSGVPGNLILKIDFGFGTSQYSTKTPVQFGFKIGYGQSYARDSTYDGRFSIQNKVTNDFNFWHVNAEDHTAGNLGGYMMVVNSGSAGGEIFRDTVKDILKGKTYEFSSYLANVFSSDFSGSETSIRPRVKFEIRTLSNELIATSYSGDIKLTSKIEWEKYGLTFTSTYSSVIILLISEAPAGNGNDLAVDDIVFQSCEEKQEECCPVITADDDGKNDYFFIAEKGKTKIFNVDGKLVKQLTTPQNWDGSDDRGTTVALGEYYVVTSEDKTYRVTVLK